MQNPWRRAMNAWLSTHHGVIDALTLHEIGCDRNRIARLVQAGELERLARGVYRSTQVAETEQQLPVAICRRHPEAVVAFTTAAHHWRFRRLPPDGATHVLVPHGWAGSMKGVVVHRSRRIDPVDVVERADGIRLTSPPRTLFDIADMVGPPVAASIIEQVLNERRLTFATIADTVSRLGHPSRPGARTMQSVLAGRAPWRAALQSDLEARVLDEIRVQGLPLPSTQHSLTLPGEVHVRLDFAWPEQQVALEVDHPFWHDGWQEACSDKVRDRRLSGMAWRTARITSLDVDGGLADAVRDLATILSFAPPLAS